MVGEKRKRDVLLAGSTQGATQAVTSTHSTTSTTTTTLSPAVKKHAALDGHARSPTAPPAPSVTRQQRKRKRGGPHKALCGGLDGSDGDSDSDSGSDNDALPDAKRQAPLSSKVLPTLKLDIFIGDAFNDYSVMHAWGALASSSVAGVRRALIKYLTVDGWGFGPGRNQTRKRRQRRSRHARQRGEEHSSGLTTSEMLAQQVRDWLRSNYNVDPKAIKVALVEEFNSSQRSMSGEKKVPVDDVKIVKLNEIRNPLVRDKLHECLAAAAGASTKVRAGRTTYTVTNQVITRRRRGFDRLRLASSPTDDAGTQRDLEPALQLGVLGKLRDQGLRVRNEFVVPAWYKNMKAASRRPTTIR